MSPFRLALLILCFIQIELCAQATFPSNPTSFFKSSTNILFFTADDGVHGRELWKTDGSLPGTSMVKDINPGKLNSNIGKLVEMNGILYFTAIEGSNFILWKTDGTTSGTMSVKILSSSLRDVELTAINNTLYFINGEDETGVELWKSDGTPEGTVIVKDLNYEQYDSYPKNLTKVGNLLFFEAFTNTANDKLYRTDGTPEGTIELKNVYPDPGQSNIAYITDVFGMCYFRATNSLGTELWKSDGTPEGTKMVIDLNPGTASSSPSELVSFQGRLYFSATNGLGGKELWTTAGTPSTTVLIKDIYPGTSSSNIANIKKIKQFLYFSATDGVIGKELWVSDGTAAGTKAITNINPGAGSSNPANLVYTRDTFFFTAKNVAGGDELWKMTNEGTLELVKDINPGAGSSNITELTTYNNFLFFSADDVNVGRELWKSSGKENSTRMFFDINQQIKIQNSGLQFVNDKVTVPFNNAYVLNAGDFTMEVKVQAMPQGAFLPSYISNLKTGKKGFHLGHMNTGRDILFVTSNSSYISSNFVNINDGQCHHLCVVKLGSSMTFYLDGNKLNTVSYNSEITSDENLSIGQPGIYGGNSGTINEVRIWNVARTSDEIKAAINYVDRLTPNLVGYWKFDDAAGQQVADSSSVGNHGYLGTSSLADSADPTWVISECPPSYITDQSTSLSSNQISPVSEPLILRNGVELSVYPNPTTGMVTVAILGNEGVEGGLSIKTLFGEILYDTKLMEGEEKTINLNQFSNTGNIFIFQFFVAGKSITKRVSLK